MPHSTRGGRLSKAESSRIIRDFLEYLDCPRALTCWILFQSGGESELVQLVNLICDEEEYLTTADFRAAYAATKFLSKVDDLKTGIDKPAVAIEGAVKAEDRCLSTNDRIKAWQSGSVMNPFGAEWFRAQQTIARILGPCPDDLLLPKETENLDMSVSSLTVLPSRRTVQSGGWSKGRTTSVSGRFLSPLNKYRGRLDVTASAARQALRLLVDSPQWGAAALDADGPTSVLRSALEITEGNVMLTVPKNAKTDRVICYEPHMNVYLQLMVGRYFRKRLRFCGVNLEDQSINRRRAKLGSLNGSLATIDLKSASDTVSCELVYSLLPIDWVCLLEDLRSKNTLWPDGSLRKNQKFSSMGNGFTFELESLLFYALCSSVSEGVSVYGDDIVVPSQNFDACVAVLEGAGFEVNSSKSFRSGPFRESCGGYYFIGSSCAPVYLRSTPKRTDDVVKLHNRVREFLQEPFSGFSPLKGLNLLRRWRARFPSLLGPSGFGDGHYHVNLDEARPSARRASHWVDGWWFVSVVRQFRKGFDVNGYHFKSLPAPLSVSLGPKAVESVYSSDIDRQYSYPRKVRVLANIWPEVLGI